MDHSRTWKVCVTLRILMSAVKCVSWPIICKSKMMEQEKMPHYDALYLDEKCRFPIVLYLVPQWSQSWHIEGSMEQHSCPFNPIQLHISVSSLTWSYPIQDTINTLNYIPKFCYFLALGTWPNKVHSSSIWAFLVDPKWPELSIISLMFHMLVVQCKLFWRLVLYRNISVKHGEPTEDTFDQYTA